MSTSSNSTKKKGTSAGKTASSVGAPAQYNQSSRRGKKAWRKNVDIEDVEGHLEEVRKEEIVTGKPLQKTADTELFQIDVKGDEKLRKSAKFSASQLTSTKILAQRSAVPAVFSRTTGSQKRKHGAVSREDKDRLLRIGKRPRRGPLNSYVDPTELGNGSATMELSEAVKKSGGYDVWATREEDESNESDDELPGRKKEAIRAPDHPHLKDIIELPAIDQPHQGMSYNPPAEAHQELLLKAHQAEERRIQEADKMAETKKRMEAARVEVTDTPEGVPAGMALDTITDEPQQSNDEGDAEGDLVPSKKQPPRKTKQQRKKSERQLAEKRALAEKAARKKMHAHIDTAKSLRQSTEKNLEAQRAALQHKQLLLREKLRSGLAGQRLGKHKVPEQEIEVQLGEDLSENLRALKPEGNLFRDRFLSLQRRALVEPRTRVLPTKRKFKTKEYEKHAWKRFE